MISLHSITEHGDLNELRARADVPLGHDTVEQLASLMGAALLPSMLSGEPGPLASAAWMAAKAMTRVADLLDPGKSAPGRSGAENAEDLADCLRSALGYAHAYWASIQSGPELAARATDSAVAQAGDEAIADRATMTLGLPNGTSITVTLGQVSYVATLTSAARTTWRSAPLWT